MSELLRHVSRSALVQLCVAHVPAEALAAAAAAADADADTAVDGTADAAGHPTPGVTTAPPDLPPAVPPRLRRGSRSKSLSGGGTPPKIPPRSPAKPPGASSSSDGAASEAKASPPAPLPPTPSVMAGVTPPASPRSRRRSTLSAAKQLIGDVGEAFRFMEDSPMFRAKLDGFASRAKQMTQELSAVIKTTDKYHHTGEKFAKLTASLAKDFRAYGSRRSADAEAAETAAAAAAAVAAAGSAVKGAGKTDSAGRSPTPRALGGLGPLLQGLGNTLHEVEAGHQTLLATLKHAFIARMQEFVDTEAKTAAALTKSFNRAFEAYESAEHRALSLKLEQETSQLAGARDKEVLEAYKAFETERFAIVRYYNQLEQRKNFELVEGITALLYSYKAYFSCAADSVITLVPHMLELQETIQEERERYEVAGKIWDRRQERLATSLEQDGETLAVPFTSKGNAEYPIETFSAAVAAAGGGLGLQVQPAAVVSGSIDYMGFLYKCSSSVRKDWKRRWFLLQGGNLYYVRNWKDSEPTLVCEVLLSTVRKCTEGRRYSFELISPNRRTFKLQACSQADMDGWMQAMQRVTETLLVGGGSSGAAASGTGGSGSAAAAGGGGGSSGGGSSGGSSGGDAAALSRHRSMNRKARAGVAAILSGSPKCADCDATPAEWVSINLGICVCLRCSGIHRSLGVHISKMRSLTLDRLAPDLLSMLQRMGNDGVNGIFEADLHVMAGWNRPTAASTTEEVKTFIRAKYEHKGFVDRLSADGEDITKRLVAAASDNDPLGVLYCLAHGADVNACVHAACRAGAVDALSLAVLNGGDLEAHDEEGLSALDVAMVSGQTACMDFCLTHMRR